MVIWAKIWFNTDIDLWVWSYKPEKSVASLTKPVAPKNLFDDDFFPSSYGAWSVASTTTDSNIFDFAPKWDGQSIMTSPTGVSKTPWTEPWTSFIDRLKNPNLPLFIPTYETREQLNKQWYEEPFLMKRIDDFVWWSINTLQSTAQWLLAWVGSALSPFSQSLSQKVFDARSTLQRAGEREKEKTERLNKYSGIGPVEAWKTWVIKDPEYVASIATNMMWQIATMWPFMRAISALWPTVKWAWFLKRARQVLKDSIWWVAFVPMIADQIFQDLVREWVSQEEAWSLSYLFALPAAFFEGITTSVQLNQIPWLKAIYSNLSSQLYKQTRNTIAEMWAKSLWRFLSVTSSEELQEQFENFMQNLAVKAFWDPNRDLLAWAIDQFWYGFIWASPFGAMWSVGRYSELQDQNRKMTEAQIAEQNKINEVSRVTWDGSSYWPLSNTEQQRTQWRASSTVTKLQDIDNQLSQIDQQIEELDSMRSWPDVDTQRIDEMSLLLEWQKAQLEAQKYNILWQGWPKYQTEQEIEVQPTVFQQMNMEYEWPKETTSKLLEDLVGKKTVARQYIQDFINRPDVKQWEKNVIREVLSEYEWKKINVPAFADRLENRLFKIKAEPWYSEYENYGDSSELFDKNPLIEAYDYDEVLYTMPYQGINKPSSHYPNKDYFWHVRQYNVQKAWKPVRYIIEKQSDLTQWWRWRLSPQLATAQEIEELEKQISRLQRENKEMQEDEDMLYRNNIRISELQERIEKAKESSGEYVKKLQEEIKEAEDEIAAIEMVQKDDELFDALLNLYSQDWGKAATDEEIEKVADMMEDIPKDQEYTIRSFFKNSFARRSSLLSRYGTLIDFEADVLAKMSKAIEIQSEIIDKNRRKIDTINSSDTQRMNKDILENKWQWHLYMLRHEIQRAVNDWKTELYLPTGQSIPYYEWWMNADNIDAEWLSLWDDIEIHGETYIFLDETYNWEVMAVRPSPSNINTNFYEFVNSETKSHYDRYITEWLESREEKIKFIENEWVSLIDYDENIDNDAFDDVVYESINEYYENMSDWDIEDFFENMGYNQAFVDRDADTIYAIIDGEVQYFDQKSGRDAEDADFTDESFQEEIEKQWWTDGLWTAKYYEYVLPNEIKKLAKQYGYTRSKERDANWLEHYVIDIEWIADKRKDKPVPAFQKQKNNLVALHNVSIEKLKWIKELWWSAAPSIAITDKSIPFDDFGDITLVWSKNLITSPRSYIYSADAYTPRVPSPDYVEKKWSWLDDFTKSIAEELSEYGIRANDISYEIENQSTSLWLWLKFLKDKWVDISVNYKRIPAPTRMQFINDIPVEELRNIEIPKSNNITSQEFAYEMQKIYDKLLSEYVSDKNRREIFTDDIGIAWADQLATYLNNIKDWSDKIDTLKLREDIRENLEKYTEEYDLYRDDLLNEFFDKKLWAWRTAMGRNRYKDYTIDNLLRHMSSMWKQWSESSIFAWSIKQLQGKTSKKQSISQAKKTSFWKKEDFESLYKDIEDRYSEIIGDLYAMNRWSYDIPASISEEFSMNRSSESIVQSLREYNIDITTEHIDKIKWLVSEIGKLPKSYIEAKIWRGVWLDEFSAIIVPESQVDEVSSILEWTKLRNRIVSYDPESENRLEKLEEVNDKFWDIFFQKKSESKHKPISREEALKIVREYFDADEVWVSFVDKIITPDGMKAFGQYFDWLISFANDTDQTTPRHEVFHAYFDLFTNDKQKREVIAETRKNKEYQDRLWDRKHSSLMAEEFLADKFDAYVRENQMPKSMKDKFMVFFDNIINEIKKFFGRDNKMKAMFDRIVTKNRDYIAQERAFNPRFMEDFDEDSFYNEFMNEIVKEWDPMRQQFIDEVAQIEHMEQRIWYVGNRKVKDPAYKKKQEMDWISRKENVIERIWEEYNLDQFEAREKYDEFTRVPESQVKWKPKQSEYVRKAEKERRKEQRIEKSRVWEKKSVDSISKTQQKQIAKIDKEIKEWAEKLGLYSEWKWEVWRRMKMMKDMQKRLWLSDWDMVANVQVDYTQQPKEKFEKYFSRLENRLEKYSERKKAKKKVYDTINEKWLQKETNYRKVAWMDLKKATAKEMLEYANTLSQFNDWDTFLWTRSIETIEKNTDRENVKTIQDVANVISDQIWVNPEDLLEVYRQKAKAKEMGIAPIQQMSWDRKLLYSLASDTTLAKSDSEVLSMMVKDYTIANMTETALNIQFEDKFREKIQAARKSRKSKTLWDKIAPEDALVFDYLEAEWDATTEWSPKYEIAQQMTPEELDLANFLAEEFWNAKEYLESRDQLRTRFAGKYVTHIQRSFLEAVKHDGIRSAIKEAVKQENEIDFGFAWETDEVIGLEKFFKYSLTREWNINPSKNLNKIIMSYFRTYYKKRALDKIIPKVVAYTYLLWDSNTNKFVKQWLNNKKGRTLDGIYQWGKIDIVASALRQAASILWLWWNIAVNVWSVVGTNMSNWIAWDTKSYARGISRSATKKWTKIAEKYKNIIGRSFWDAWTIGAKTPWDKMVSLLFGLMQEITYKGKKQFLLWQMTKEEYNTGELSPERQAEIKLLIDETYPAEDGKWMWWNTIAWKTFWQFKSWAVPYVERLIQNSSFLIKDAKKKWLISWVKSLWTTREWQQLMKSTIWTLLVAKLILTMLASDEDDQDYSIIWRLKRKVIQESTSSVEALNPLVWLTAPSVDFTIDLLSYGWDSLRDIGLLLIWEDVDRYKRDGKYWDKWDVKSFAYFMNFIKPVLLRQLEKQDKKSSTSTTIKFK